MGSRGLVAKLPQEKTSDARVPSDVLGDPLCMQQSPHQEGVQGLPGRARAPEFQKPRWAARKHTQNAGSGVSPGTKPPAGEQSGQPRARPLQLTEDPSRVRVPGTRLQGTSPAECSAVGTSTQERVWDPRGGPPLGGSWWARGSVTAEWCRES